MKKYILAAAASVAFAALATPASAATVVSPCDPNLTNPDAVACAGYYGGNILSGNPTDVADQQAAIASLPGTFTWNGVWAPVEATTQLLANLNGNQLSFGTALYGLTVIGAHFGNVDGPAGNVTVFWEFDFGTTGAQYVAIEPATGFSRAVLYTTGTPPRNVVPEPATWLMMMLGFGAIGFGLRRKSQVRVRFAGI